MGRDAHQTGRSPRRPSPPPPAGPRWESPPPRRTWSPPRTGTQRRRRSQRGRGGRRPSSMCARLGVLPRGVAPVHTYTHTHTLTLAARHAPGKRRQSCRCGRWRSAARSRGKTWQMLERSYPCSSPPAHRRQQSADVGSREPAPQRTLRPPAPATNLAVAAVEAMGAVDEAKLLQQALPRALEFRRRHVEREGLCRTPSAGRRGTEGTALSCRSADGPPSFAGGRSRLQLPAWPAGRALRG